MHRRLIVLHFEPFETMNKLIIFTYIEIDLISFYMYMNQIKNTQQKLRTKICIKPINNYFEKYIFFEYIYTLSCH